MAGLTGGSPYRHGQLVVVEAAALSLQLTPVAENQTLAAFLSGRSHDTTPDWRIKPYVQNFLNLTKGRSSRVLKIDREQDAKAHSLALQAYRTSVVVCLADKPWQKVLLVNLL